MDENRSLRATRAKRATVAFDAGTNPPGAKKAGKRKAPASGTQPDNGAPKKADKRSTAVRKGGLARQALEPTSGNNRAPVTASEPSGAQNAEIVELTEDDDLGEDFDDAGLDLYSGEGVAATAAVEEFARGVESAPPAGSQRGNRGAESVGVREGVGAEIANRERLAARDVSEGLFVRDEVDEAQIDDTLVNVRRRAGVGNFDKAAIATALTATVFHDKMTRNDRWVISLRKETLMDFYKVKKSLRRIIERYSWPPNVDFELLLAPADALAPVAAASQTQAGLSQSQRPRIATNIQEQGLANTIEAGVAAQYGGATPTKHRPPVTQMRREPSCEAAREISREPFWEDIEVDRSRELYYHALNFVN
ncbi:hypothetical protein BDV95DRAFT_664650 [Massariosphaeria phaeospora]|uniref:Uncharacterized protein n=1 Tax=Massariosphaeria phaeospora TaxID=100035 RepID=A0A7C8MW95_9PLEO|nr:hypothetical protein BDV95DRAFT_664650 [Massariosphaeria phaeospora]